MVPAAVVVVAVAAAAMGAMLAPWWIEKYSTCALQSPHFLSSWPSQLSLCFPGLQTIKVKGKG